ncbi:hypothetical protein ABK040_001309 [Willaertia magna]
MNGVTEPSLNGFTNDFHHLVPGNNNNTSTNIPQQINRRRRKYKPIPLLSSNSEHSSALLQPTRAFSSTPGSSASLTSTSNEQQTSPPLKDVVFSSFFKCTRNAIEFEAGSIGGKRRTKRKKVIIPNYLIHHLDSIPSTSTSFPHLFDTLTSINYNPEISNYPNAKPFSLSHSNNEEDNVIKQTKQIISINNNNNNNNNNLETKIIQNDETNDIIIDTNLIPLKQELLKLNPTNVASYSDIQPYFLNFTKQAIPSNFIYIFENVRRKPLNNKHNNKKKRKEEDLHCMCTTMCVPNECLNYLSQVECLDSCQCGENCFNHLFTKRNYPNIICFESKEKGIGVKCNELIIKKGQFITEYVGELITKKEFEKRTKTKYQQNNYHFYCMNLNDNEIIDATIMGNIGRFINHSCSPNCNTQIWLVNGSERVGIFANKDITFGEEITYNYNFTIYGEKEDIQICKCGSPSCTGAIGRRFSLTKVNNNSDSSNSEGSDSDSSNAYSSSSSGSDIVITNVTSSCTSDDDKDYIDTNSNTKRKGNKKPVKRRSIVRTKSNTSIKQLLTSSKRRKRKEEELKKVDNNHINNGSRSSSSIQVQQQVSKLPEVVNETSEDNNSSGDELLQFIDSD